MMYKDLHIEDPEVAKKIRALLRLGLFDHAKIISTEIYEIFELEYIKCDDITHARFHGTTWNGALDSLLAYLPPVKRN